MLNKLFLYMSIIMLLGCQSSVSLKNEYPPLDPNPPALNCAADGPGCKQFNPNKP